MSNHKKANPKTKYLRCRVSENEKNYILKLAYEAGLCESDFLRRLIFDDKPSEEKQDETIHENLINIQRQNYIISKLLIMVASDVNRNELLAEKPIPEKVKSRIINYLDHITNDSPFA